MAYNGDFNPGDTINLKFTTVAATGAPTSLVGGAVSVYKDGSLTQSTAGVTLTADFDGVTGLNNVAITLATDGTYYSGGSNFQVIPTAGTVGGVSIVGYVVCEFSLNARAALRPTTAGATIDVQPDGSVIASGGLTEAGVAAAASAAVWAAAVRSLTDKTGFDLSPAGIIAVWAAATRELSASGVAAITTALASSFAALPDAIWDEIVDGVLTARDAMRLKLSADAGKLSGVPIAGTPGTVVIRDPADTKNRITASVDGNGNRTAVVLDVT